MDCRSSFAARGSHRKWTGRRADSANSSGGCRTNERRRADIVDVSTATIKSKIAKAERERERESQGG
jgi:hypothetical protein